MMMPGVNMDVIFLCVCARLVLTGLLMGTLSGNSGTAESWELCKTSIQAQCSTQRSCFKYRDINVGEARSEMSLRQGIVPFMLLFPG